MDNDTPAGMWEAEAPSSEHMLTTMPRAVIDLFKPLAGGGRRDIFAHITREERNDILARGVRRTLPKGAQLYTEGAELDRNYVIEAGLIRAYHTAPSGREITLAYWQPGSFVGSPDIFQRSTHMWTGEAVHPTTVISFSGKDVRQLMERHPGWAIGVIDALAFKIRCFSALVQVLGTRSIRERLSQILLALCMQYGKPHGKRGILIDARFTHEDLAHMVGSSRQWVTTTLDKFQQQGVVKLGRGSLIVLQPERLSRLEDM